MRVGWAWGGSGCDIVHIPSGGVEEGINEQCCHKNNKWCRLSNHHAKWLQEKKKDANPITLHISNCHIVQGLGTILQEWLCQAFRKFHMLIYVLPPLTSTHSGILSLNPERLSHFIYKHYSLLLPVPNLTLSLDTLNFKMPTLRNFEMSLCKFLCHVKIFHIQHVSKSQ